MKNLERFQYFSVPGILAVTAFALQMLTANNYGFFPDEFYYIACARHPAFGYVDHPAMVALWTKLSLLFGDSTYALHFLPALAGAGTIILTARIARAFGGSRFAASLAALAVLDGTVFWVMFGFMSVNAFDIFMVTLTGYLFLLALQNPSTLRWFLLGIAAGVGLNTKMTMLVFGFGLLAGLLLGSRRKFLLTLPPYVAAFTAFVLFIPFLLWQATHDWPTLEFIKNAALHKNLDLSLVQYFLALTVSLGPLILCISALGLAFLLMASSDLRPTAFSIVVFFTIYLMNRSNFYYVVPAFPLLIAAGSGAIERWTEVAGRRWIRAGALTLIAVSALVKLPLGVPLLPIDTFVKYAGTFGLAETITTDKSQSVTVPFYFGKRFGTEELIQEVGKVYHALPDSDQADCGILGSNYTFAGAVDYYGSPLGVPPAISGHNSYWLWGPGRYSGKVMVAVGFRRAYLERLFQRVDLASTFEYPYEEGNSRTVRIFVCRGSREPMGELWKKLKIFS